MEKEMINDNENNDNGVILNGNLKKRRENKQKLNLKHDPSQINKQ